MRKFTHKTFIFTSSYRNQGMRVLNVVKNAKLKTKLTAAISSAILVTIMSLSIVSIRMSSNAIRTNVIEGLESTLNSSALVLNEVIERHFDLVSSVAALNRIHDEDNVVRMGALKSEAKRLEFLTMGLMDLEGWVYYPGEEKKKPSPEIERSLRSVLKGESVVSTVIVDSKTKETYVIFAVPVYDQENTKKVIGAVLAHEDSSVITNVTNEIHYGEKGYAWIADGKGTVIAHSNKDLITNKVNFIDNARTDESFVKLGEMVEQMIQGKTGNSIYLYKGSNRMFAYGPVEGTDWSIAVGTFEEDALAEMVHAKWMILGVSIVVLLLGVIVTIPLSSAIVKPIMQTTAMLKDIAQGEGDLTKRLTITTHDEVGELVEWFNTFIEKVHGIITEIAENSRTLSASSHQVSATAETIAANTEEMTTQANSVAAASEESSSNIQSISASAEEMSASMNVVASAIEEMSAAIKEVSLSCQKESEIAEKATLEAEGTSAAMAELGKAANAVGSIVDVIQQIAAQTNLLALNATIEAASAGEAGKGFAVVANEVKELAKQTSTATEDIRKQVEEMQKNSGNAIDAIHSIGGTIQEINSISHSIVVSVEQQNGAIGEIAQNVAGVNEAAQDVTRNVTESATALDEVSRTILEVNSAATDTSRGIQEVGTSIDELAKLAAQLDGIVGQFKI